MQNSFDFSFDPSADFDSDLGSCLDYCFDPSKATVVLASASPRRKMLLEQAGINFVIRVSDIDETLNARSLPELNDAVMQLASQKANAVAQQVILEGKSAGNETAVAQSCDVTGARSSSTTSDKSASYYVIGADTIVVLEDEVLGKPKDLDDAKRMLQKLSGVTHRVLTAVSVCALYVQDNDKTLINSKSFVDSSSVSFKSLSESDIDNYLQTGESFDKAGAYAVQGEGAKLIAKIDGDPNTVIGLPIKRLLTECPKIALAGK